MCFEGLGNGAEIDIEIEVEEFTMRALFALL